MTIGQTELKSPHLGKALLHGICRWRFHNWHILLAVILLHCDVFFCDGASLLTITGTGYRPRQRIYRMMLRGCGEYLRGVAEAAPAPASLDVCDLLNGER